MNRVSLFAMVLLLVASFASCRKINATKGIAFGDASKMEITIYDTVANYLDKTIDADGDGDGDLQLSLTFPGSAGLGHWMKASIKCMPGTGLLGEVIDQKNYIHIDTTYRMSDGSVVVALYNKYFTCNMMSKNDSMYLNKDRFVLYANDEGDIFSLDDTYLDTEAKIYEDSYQVPMGWSTEPVNDTVTYLTYNYLNDCENFPLDTPKYIGFKLSKSNTTRLGWVKIKLGHNSIELIETAIQK